MCPYWSRKILKKNSTLNLSPAHKGCSKICQTHKTAVNRRKCYCLFCNFSQFQGYILLGKSQEFFMIVERHFLCNFCMPHWVFHWIPGKNPCSARFMSGGVVTTYAAAKTFMVKLMLLRHAEVSSSSCSIHTITLFWAITSEAFITETTKWTSSINTCGILQTGMAANVTFIYIYKKRLHSYTIYSLLRQVYAWWWLYHCHFFTGSVNQIYVFYF